MSSEIKVSSVKAKDGTAGISIADSTGRVTFTETNPSITLGSNTTFPAGHVIKRYSQIRSSGNATLNHTVTTSWTKIDFGGNFDISGVTATQNNILRLTIANINWHTDDDNTYQTMLAVTTDGTTVDAANILAHWGGYNNDATSYYVPITFIWEYTVPASFTNKTLSVVTRRQTGSPSNSWSWNLQQNANLTGAVSDAIFLVEEIQT